MAITPETVLIWLLSIGAIKCKMCASRHKLQSKYLEQVRFACCVMMRLQCHHMVSGLFTSIKHHTIDKLQTTTEWQGLVILVRS